LTGMLEGYLGLKHVSLIIAKSDSPGWIGQGMTVDDDIHVKAARSVIAKVKGGAK